MKELPILFSTPMVQAILAGRKTQTRRIMNPQLILVSDGGSDSASGYNGKIWVHPKNIHEGNIVKFSKWQAGDRLYIRERTRLIHTDEYGDLVTGVREDAIVRLRYEADGYEALVPYPTRLAPLEVGKCVPNGCYKEAARIWLEVTNVRIERLQDISGEDAVAEGITDMKGIWTNYQNGDGFIDTTQFKWPNEDVWMWAEQASYRTLWQSINGADSWKDNPWVWVIEFKVLSTTGKPTP